MVEGQRVSVPAAIGVAVVFGVALGGAAAIGVALGWTEPYWVPEPIVLLLVYILLGKRELVRQKALGTAIGAIAVVPVAIAAPPTWAIYLIAAVALLLAVMTVQHVLALLRLLHVRCWFWFLLHPARSAPRQRIAVSKSSRASPFS